MPPLVLTDAKVWLDGKDLSGDLNSVSLEAENALQENTVFGNQWRSRKGGLSDVSFNHEGYVDLDEGAVDEVLFNKLALESAIMSLSPDGGDAGDVAYTFKSIQGAYNPGASIGEMFAFTVSGNGRGPLVRGTVMENGTISADGQSTARNLGSVGSNQKLYATLHVLSVSGTNPTLDVVVRSDDSSGMGSPTTQITFNQATQAGAQWGTPVAGEITDTWFDIDFTVGGTNPSFVVVVIIGIQ